MLTAEKAPSVKRSQPASFADRRDLFAGSLIFAVGFAAIFLYQLGLDTPRSTFMHDGMHYLQTSSRLTELFIALLHWQWANAAAITADQSFHQLLTFDGPITTVLPALVFASCGHVPWTADWMPIIAINAAMYGLTASLLYTLARTVFGNRLWSVLTAVVFLLYPPVHVSAGRFLTETPTTFFLLAFVLSSVLALQRKGFALVAGLAGGAVCLAKPALILLVAIAGLLSTVRQRNKGDVFKFSSSFAFGLILLMVPWYIYTGSVSGHATITVDRNPCYNAAVGTDLEMDGWCTIPESPHVVKRSDRPDVVLLNAWMKQPAENCVLTLRKLTRLYAYPWNDYRQNVFGLSTQNQVLFHQLMLILGAFGASLFLLQVQKNTTDSGSSRFALELSLVTVAGHLGYLLFQPMSRYAFTSMPYVLLFAMWGLLHLKNKLEKNVLLSGVLAVVAFLLITCGDSSTRLQAPTEVAHTLQPGQQINRVIDLTADSAKGTALVLVDADAGIEQADVFINHQKVEEHLRPIGMFSQRWYELLSTIRDHADALDVDPSNIRQWRAVAVPTSMLKSGKNEIRICNSTSSSFSFYSDSRASQVIPSPNYFASDKMLDSPNSLDPRVSAPLLSSSGFSQQDAPRIVLATERSGAKRKDVPVKRTIDLEALYIDAGKSSGPLQAVTVSAPIEKLPNSTHIRVALSGKIDTISGPGRVGLQSILLAGKDSRLMLARCPDHIGPDKNFYFEDVVPTSFFKGPVDSIVVAAYPCSATQAQYGKTTRCSAAWLKDIQITVEAVNSADLTGSDVRYF